MSDFYLPARPGPGSHDDYGKRQEKTSYQEEYYANIRAV